MPLLEVSDLKKIYTTRFGGAQVQALSSVSFSVAEGEYVAIMGESGSGKTTLLNILAALDKPSSGRVLLDGRDITGIPERELSAFRRDKLGFVFQDFNLLDTFTLRDNIYLPLVLAKTDPTIMERRLHPLMKRLRIEKIIDRFPSEVSGGQQQRVAIARALIAQPDLLLADEPTGALDSNTSAEILELFDDVNKNGQTILMVTHSAAAASHAKRTLFIKDGRIYHELFRGDLSMKKYQEEISDTMMTLTNGGK